MSVEGYVYVADQSDGIMTQAEAGRRSSLEERRPPFIVVTHSIDSINVAQWPGKVWRVRIVDPVTESDEQVGYTRAVSVDVLEEIPISQLFGEHGEAVCAVIARANELQVDQVHSLAKARHRDAGAAYSRAWDKWSSGAGVGRSGSPINAGFSVIGKTVQHRAETLAGTNFFLINEEGNRYLEPTWSTAANALLEAAMAFGAPALSSNKDLAALTSAWRSVFGEGWTNQEH